MRTNKIGAYALLCGSILLAMGCSTTQEALSAPIFYPPAPGDPRLQYLTSVSDSSDLVPPVNAFKKFLLGDSSTDISGIVKPYGMAIQGTKLYVCDTIGAQVHVLDFEARTWDHFRPAISGGIKKIITIAVDSENVRYMADPMRGEGIINSSDGKFVAAIAGEEKMKPVGLAVSEDRIFIGDLEQKKVHVYDKAGRQLLFSIPLTPDNEQEQLFAPTNIALDQKGNIYVSDMLGNSIFRLSNDRLELWVTGDELLAPNGLMVKGNDLLVATWGVRTEGFSTSVVGHLKTVSLDSQSVASFGNGVPVGNLDGLEPDGNGSYRVTDWMAGALYRIHPSGDADLLLDLNQISG